MMCSRIVTRIVVVMGLFLTVTLTAQQNKESLSLGIYAGPAVPSDGVSDVYGALDTAGATAAYSHASTLGYHIGGKLRFGLSDNISFSGGAAMVRFAGQDQSATLDNGQILKLQTATTLVPISAGFTAFAFRGLIAPYISAEATYTYRTVTIATGNSLLQDLIVNSANGIELEPSTSRIGAAAAAGVQLDIGGLKPFVELRYHWTNLVGMDSSEESISYLNISLGLIL